jgi:hypothetical protein
MWFETALWLGVIGPVAALAAQLSREGEKYEAIARVGPMRILLPSEQRAKIGHEQNGDLEGASHCP